MIRFRLKDCALLRSRVRTRRAEAKNRRDLWRRSSSATTKEAGALVPASAATIEIEVVCTGEEAA
jgi:hypothetical protein